jgi:arsenical pump membrane protein
VIGGSQAVSEVVCIVLLLAVPACAVVRPRGWPEVVVALPAAIAVVLLGGVSASEAWAETDGLLPVGGFLAAILMLARLCDDDGLFSAAGATVGRVWGGGSTSLLFGVFVRAALTTAVLSLDATVVLLTPVVFATTAQVGVRARPHVYACMHLANSGSLALPVSNLTNLLALTASGLTFTRFAGLMIVPWLAAIAVEYLVFRLYFRGDLGTRSHRSRQYQHSHGRCSPLSWSCWSSLASS